MTIRYNIPSFKVSTIELEIGIYKARKYSEIYYKAIVPIKGSIGSVSIPESRAGNTSKANQRVY